MPQNNGLLHSEEFERAVLGSVILDNSCLSLVLESLSSQDFYAESHRLIFDAEVSLAESWHAIDYLTLTEHLTQAGNLPRCGGASFLSSLTDGVPVGTDHSVREYCRIVKEYSTRRRALKISQQFAEQYSSVYEGDPKALVDSQILALSGLISNGKHGFEVVGDSFDNLNMDRVVFGKSPKGIMSGFSELDSLTMGFQAGELTLIAARPTIGKTAIGLNISTHAANLGSRIGFFSVEMNRESLLVRLICSASGISSHRLRSDRPSDEECSNVLQMVSELRNLPIHIDDSSGLTVAEAKAKAVSLKNKHGLDLLIVDYLQLMTGGKSFEGKGHREQEVAFVSRNLKAIAKELKIPVIALTQLNREPEKGGKSREPNLTDLRESGSLEMDADVVIFLHRQPDAVDNGQGIVTDLLLKKQRNGPTGRVRLLFNRSCTRFEPYVEKTQPEYEQEWGRKRKRQDEK